MPQPGNDHSDDRHADIGPGLIENQKIEAGSPSDLDTGVDWFAGVAKRPELRAGEGMARRLPIRNQEEIVPQVHGVVPSRLDFSPVPPPISPMDRNWFSSVNARSKAMRLSKCAPDPNSIFSWPFCIQCKIATNVGTPRSLVTSSTHSRRPDSASCVCKSRT